MKLIGMLDSPYVRRVAISAKCLGIDLEHESVSVFRHFEQFQQINPVVKAPTLILDDGMVLMDSTLILDYLESASGKSLLPKELPQRAQALRLIGLSLAACEKAVQLYYERNLRPADIHLGLNALKANSPPRLPRWKKNSSIVNYPSTARSPRMASAWRLPGASPTLWCPIRSTPHAIRELPNTPPTPKAPTPSSAHR